MCPKCSGGNHDLDEEEDLGLCIHEKAGITVFGLAVVVTVLLGTGVI